MHMTAERGLRLAPGKAVAGRSPHPSHNARLAGSDASACTKSTSPELHLQRQRRQETLGRFTQLLARPSDGLCGGRVHVPLSARARLVMIAHNGNGTFGHELRDPLHHGFRVRAITHKIAQNARRSTCSLRGCRKAGLKCRQIRVNVGKSAMRMHGIPALQRT